MENVKNEIWQLYAVIESKQYIEKAVKCLKDKLERKQSRRVNVKNDGIKMKIVAVDEKNVKKRVKRNVITMPVRRKKLLKCGESDESALCKKRVVGRNKKVKIECSVDDEGFGVQKRIVNKSSKIQGKDMNGDECGGHEKDLAKQLTKKPIKITKNENPESENIEENKKTSCKSLNLKNNKKLIVKKPIKTVKAKKVSRKKSNNETDVTKETKLNVVNKSLNHEDEDTLANIFNISAISRKKNANIKDKIKAKQKNKGLKTGVNQDNLDLIHGYLENKSKIIDFESNKNDGPSNKENILKSEIIKEVDEMNLEGQKYASIKIIENQNIKMIYEEDKENLENLDPLLNKNLTNKRVNKRRAKKVLMEEVKVLENIENVQIPIEIPNNEIIEIVPDKMLEDVFSPKDTSKSTVSSENKFTAFAADFNIMSDIEILDASLQDVPNNCLNLSIENLKINELLKSHKRDLEKESEQVSLEQKKNVKDRTVSDIKREIKALLATNFIDKSHYSHVENLQPKKTNFIGKSALSKFISEKKPTDKASQYVAKLKLPTIDFEGKLEKTFKPLPWVNDIKISAKVKAQNHDDIEKMFKCGDLDLVKMFPSVQNVTNDSPNKWPINK